MLIYQIFTESASLVSLFINNNTDTLQLKEGFCQINKKIEENFSANVAQFLHYNLCCFADDIILQHNSQWRHTLLEDYFFNTHQGGEKFFITLENIEENRGFFLFDQLILLYLMLVCGFKGKYLDAPEDPPYSKQELAQEEQDTNLKIPNPQNNNPNPGKLLGPSNYMLDKNKEPPITSYLELLYKKIKNHQFVEDFKELANEVLLKGEYVELKKHYSWVYVFAMFLLIFVTLSSTLWYMYLQELKNLTLQISPKIFDYKLT